MSKPRSDSRLKTLPGDRQDAIAEYARDHSLAEIVKWLRDDGIITSPSRLSEYLSWYALRAAFRATENTTHTLIEELKREVPEISDQQLDALGQRTFSLLAIQSQDQESFLAVRSARFEAEIEREKLRLRQEAGRRQAEKLALERQKFQRETCNLFLRWSEDQRALEISTGPASNADKIERLGTLMFQDLWQ